MESRPNPVGWRDELRGASSSPSAFINAGRRTLALLEHNMFFPMSPVPKDILGHVRSKKIPTPLQYRQRPCTFSERETQLTVICRIWLSCKRNCTRHLWHIATAHLRQVYHQQLRKQTCAAPHTPARTLLLYRLASYVNVSGYFPGARL